MPKPLQKVLDAIAAKKTPPVILVGGSSDYLAERAFHEAGLMVQPKAIATRAEWLYELVSAGVGIGVAALHHDLTPDLVNRPVEGAALTHEINLTTKRGRLYSPPVKAFVDLALRPRRRTQATAA